MKKNKKKGKINRNKEIQSKKKNDERPRYHDMRLVWFFLALTGIFLLIRYLLCQHFGIPFLNEANPAFPDEYFFIGQEELSKQYRLFEGWLCASEMLTALLCVCFFVEEPPNKDGKYHTENIPILTSFWILALMGLAPVIIYRPTSWWIVYSTVMTLLAVFIGKVEGFGLPTGRKQYEHLLGSATDVTIETRFRKIYFPGKSSIWFVAIVFIGLYGITIYTLIKAL